jgi:hypothetical protein
MCNINEIFGRKQANRIAGNFPVQAKHAILIIGRNDMQVTLDVPDVANISQTDAQLLFAMKLFEADKLPLGKAAEMAGLSYRAVYELL